MTSVVVAALAALGVVGAGAAARMALRLSRRAPVIGRLEPVRPAQPVRASERRPLPQPPPGVAQALASADLPVAPGVAWAAWLGAVVVGPLAALVLAGPGLAALTVLGLTSGPALVVRCRRGRADARLERALPGALEAVARSLRSGASLRQAVEEAGTAAAGEKALAAEFSRAAAEAARGASLVTALEGMAERRPLPGVRLGVAALCLGAETGGAHARAVDGVAATVRERLAVAAELRALSSQARISALVIGLAPVGFGAFAAATDPRSSQFLLHTPPGLVLLAVGLVLDGLGWLWMQRLARVSV